MSDLIGNVTNRTATLRDEYRFVVEMWAAYRFACSDTPSPEKLDRMLALCDDRTMDLVKRYGLAFSEDVLFGERKIAHDRVAQLEEALRQASHDLEGLAGIEPDRRVSPTVTLEIQRAKERIDEVLK